MTSDPTDQKYNEQRLDAIEFVLEHVLSMLITASPNQREIRSRLLELAQSPPTEIPDKTSLQHLLDAIELACPDDENAPL